MRKLYEINEDIERVLDEAYTMKIDDENAVDKATGEVFSVVEKLNALAIEKNEKIKSVALYMEDIKGKLQTVKERAEAITKMKQSLQRELDGLKEYLLYATDKKGFVDNDIEIKMTSRSCCVITDETLIPEKFIKTKTETSISKEDIKKALNNGEVVPGAALGESWSLKVI